MGAEKERLMSKPVFSTAPPDPEAVPRRPARRFTPDQKQRILAEIDAASIGTVGGILRREGLYYSMLTSWHKTSAEDHRSCPSAGLQKPFESDNEGPVLPSNRPKAAEGREEGEALRTTAPAQLGRPIMRTRSKKHQQRVGLILVFCFLCQASPPSSKATSFVNSSTDSAGAQKKAVDLLKAMGAKQLEPNGSQFEVEAGVTLSLSYLGSTLAAVRVTLTSAHQGTNLKESTLPEESNERVTCCMTGTEYARFLSIAARLKPIGTLTRRDTVGIIPTSGWVRRSDEYSRARTVYLERACADSKQQSDCGIARFTVFYRLPLRGKVSRKRVERSDVLGTSMIRYLVTVGATEVEVSRRDYGRFHEAELVKLEHTLDNTFARVLTLRRSR